MAAKKRIYAVTDCINVREDGTLPVSLVRARNKAQALSHVAKAQFDACVASQEALVSALSSGVAVDDAGDDEPVEEGEE